MLFSLKNFIVIKLTLFLPRICFGMFGLVPAKKKNESHSQVSKIGAFS